VSHPCAVCNRGVKPDTDHVEITETIWMDDRNDQRSYILHLGCAMRTIDAWEEQV
jgi:hypothetical protein